MSALVPLLRVIGVSFIILNLIFLATLLSVLPQFFVASPPVDIVKERSGLHYTEESGHYHLVRIRNRSDKSQTVVVVLKTDIDYNPRRSDPVFLSPHEEKDVIIIPIQPTSATNLQEYVECLTRPSILRVEYTETLLPSGSSATFLVHLFLQALFFIIGGIFLGAAQYISRAEKVRSHEVK